MATGNIQGSDSLSTLTSLLGMLKGSSQTQTSGSNISAEGTNAILQQILSGSGGLATVAGGQKSAGLYNSSTNQLLTNDLLSRTAGEVAKLKAGTTSKTSTPAKFGGSDIAMLLGAAGAKSLLGPSITGLSKKFSADDLGGKLASALGLGDSGSGIVDSTATNLFAGADPSSYAENLTGGIADALASFGSSLASDSFSSIGTDVAANLFSDTAASAGADVASSVVSSGISEAAVEEGTNFFATLFGG